jgi:hypothetical protein
MAPYSFLQGIRVRISGSKAINSYYNHNLPAHINPPIMANSSDIMARPHPTSPQYKLCFSGFDKTGQFLHLLKRPNGNLLIDGIFIRSRVNYQQVIKVQIVKGDPH